MFALTTEPSGRGNPDTEDPFFPACASMVFARFGMLCSMHRRAWGPPISVRTQPGAMSSRVRGSSASRAAKLRMNMFTSRLLRTFNRAISRTVDRRSLPIASIKPSWFRLLVTCPTLIAYWRDSDNVERENELLAARSGCHPRHDEFPNAIVFSSSDEWLRFENADGVLMFPCPFAAPRRIKFARRADQESAALHFVSS